jgi:hypothetical protein
MTINAAWFMLDTKPDEEKKPNIRCAVFNMSDSGIVANYTVAATFWFARVYLPFFITLLTSIRKLSDQCLAD